MARSEYLKAIHIVGYLTTPIVMVELAFLGYLAWTRWSNSQQIDARFRDGSRTHWRALSANGADILEDDAATAYQPVRPPAGAGDDVVGYVSMPSFSPWFAASFRLPRGANVAQGEVVTVQHGGVASRLTISPLQTFTVPREAFLQAVQQVDALTGGWPGSGANGCMDGAPVAFERVGSGRVTSGVGNASCDPHYAAVDQILMPLLSRFGPKLAKSSPSAVND